MKSTPFKTIAVLAANGRSGRLFVEAALKAGYTVKAGVHGQHDFLPNEQLIVIPVDGTKQADVDALVQGSDVVVSLIGHGPKSPATVQTDTIRNTVSAMQTHGVRRLISLTGTGVRIPGDKPSLIDRFANLAISIIDPERIKDGIAHVKLLQASDVDWTVVRVLKLGNGTTNGTVTFSTMGPAELLTPRTRVAYAIVQILNDDLFIKQAPIITGVKQ